MNNYQSSICFLLLIELQRRGEKKKREQLDQTTRSNGCGHWHSTTYKFKHYIDCGALYAIRVLLVKHTEWTNGHVAWTLTIQSKFEQREKTCTNVRTHSGAKTVGKSLCN